MNRTIIQELQPWFNNSLKVFLTKGSKVPGSSSYVKEFKEKHG
ncbi:LytTR family transcriptional regulator DNA-binding domain-containing protein [Enterococcus faecalis]